ncbi:MAG TPA: metabolite traffic protein EboE [Candidatus Dormibacteraeota bacterium]|nr:metabolite traffic protein EboE [Candidatus Dormibacteraeota bacterium]
MRVARDFNLTYCSNIHPGEGWAQVYDNLRRYAPELKKRLSPDAPFGVGLRLSNSESLELLEGTHLDEFASFLQDAGLYVALINGYPYGRFHGLALKDQVFAPDWHSAERLDYTLRLSKILLRLLPQGMDGGVSTCPLSYKPWYKNGAAPDRNLLIGNLVKMAHALVETKRRSGALIHLDIEPEPDGLLENTAEFVQFFEQLLQKGTSQLASLAQLSLRQAEEALREHITLCYDLCHFAVEGEGGPQTLQAVRQAGIRVGRVQLSSAVRVSIPPAAAEREQLRERLSSFADPVYLHQIIGDRERYADLGEGLERLAIAHSSEWRIHYHVPLFLKDYGILGSTQQEVRDALAELDPGQAHHLEIETYTWDVLPAGLKVNIVDSIEREYRWVLDQL